MNDKKVVIKRSLLGNVLMLLVCAAFAVIGFWLIKSEEHFWLGIFSIVFFGGGGLLFSILMMRKPIAVLSHEGITVPYGWGENFVAWENVDRFEIMEQRIRSRNTNQTVKCIGIFVHDSEGIVGAGSLSKTLSKEVTGLDKVPDMTITLAFSFIKIEKVMKILQEHYDKCIIPC